MADNLPQLPEPRGLLDTGGGWMAPTKHFTAEQMQAYARAALAQAQSLPAGFGGGLVAIKTLLSRDPCAHATTAIAMIDAMLEASPQPQPVQPSDAQWQKRHPLRTDGQWENTNEHDAKWWRDNSQGWEIRALYTANPPQPERVPMSIQEIDTALQEHKRIDMGNIDPVRGVFILGVVAAERHHHITKKE